ncbi:MAG: glycosyltransferase [Bacteroidota bacterium]
MKKKPTIVFIASYLPRECGIATFTKDTITAIEKSFHPNFSLKVAALNEHPDVERTYPPEVIFQVQKDANDYKQLADIINLDTNIQLVVIEHEFGLYAGEFGEDLLKLTEALQKPYLLVMHTVLSQPPEKMKVVLANLILGSARAITMTTHSRRLLIENYNVPGEKLSIIPHGFHLRPSISNAVLKAKYNCRDRIVLSTFGLLSRNKGIELALDALAEVNHRDFTVYFILGKTHPEVKKNEGEEYRDFLQQKVKDHGLENNVQFVNRFLELDELLEYLQMTDIYLFTSIDPEQAISGTLTYALGAGCAVLTTPISHAREILDANAALPFNFGESHDLAQRIDQLIEDESLRKELSVRAKIISRKGMWENIAIRYADIFAELLDLGERLVYAKPEINLHHLKNMTNGIGMFQFTDMDHPNEKFGFTLDDNARALYVLSNYQELYPQDKSVKQLQKTYLDFTLRCQLKDGGFLNYVDKYGDFTDQNNYINTDEAGARAMLALCRLTHSQVGSKSSRKKAKKAIKNSLSYMSKVMSPRAIGKILKGLYYLYLRKKDDRILEIVHDHADYLCELYQIHSSKDWRWFEPHLSYSNSDIPEGLLYASVITKTNLHKNIGIESLEFLLEKMLQGKIPMPVSHRSDINKSKKDVIDQFGQQPVELASLVECLDIAFKITGEQRYYDLLISTFTWFLGNNLLRQIVYNPATGAGHDGIEKQGINLNQGAESTLSYLISLMTVEKNLRMQKQTPVYEMVD